MPAGCYPGKNSYYPEERTTIMWYLVNDTSLYLWGVRLLLQMNLSTNRVARVQCSLYQCVAATILASSLAQDPMLQLDMSQVTRFEARNIENAIHGVGEKEPQNQQISGGTHQNGACQVQLGRRHL